MAPLLSVPRLSSYASRRFSFAVLLGTIGLVAECLVVFRFISGGMVISPRGATASVFGFGFVAYLFCRRGSDAGASVWTEILRLSLLAGLASLAIHPFITRQFVGGQDARWYAYVLADSLEQARAGVFPVLVGQGNYQFNGSVHPFRFAPFYQNLGGVLDWLTGRSLDTVAVQHLTIVFVSWVSAFGAYFGFTAWAPRFRWSAFLMACLYVVSPGALALLCVHDMYMSYMAAAWVPLVFHFARRVTQTRSFFSAVCLGACLAVVFNCHPPVALWCLFGSIAFVLLVILAEAEWARGFVLCFVSVGSLVTLNAFQFVGIAELSPVSGGEFPWRSVAIFIGAVVGCLATRVYFHQRHAQNVKGRSYAASMIPVAVGIGTLILLHRIFAPPATGMARDSIDFSRKFVPLLWQGVSASGTELTDCQPGWWLLAASLVASLLVWRIREVTTAAFVLLSAIFTLILLPFTPFARAFWETVPGAVIAFTSGIVNFRITPVWITLMSFAVFGGLVQLGGHKWVFRTVFSLLVVGAVWTGFQSQRILRFSESLTRSFEQTQLIMRPENAELFIYSGNFIGLPDYFSHGVRDYRRESRILDLSTHTPLSVAAPLPAVSSQRTVLTSFMDPLLPGWVKLTPAITIEPGQTKDVHFEFTNSASGVLVLEGPQFYREYILPFSGNALSFGSGATNDRVLPLWTTLEVPQQVSFRFRPNAASDLPASGAAFATFTETVRDERNHPVRTLALLPLFRAQVDLDRPALLETPRTWIPGYTALRNGRPVEIVRSRNNLVSVPLEVGHNQVEIGFQASRRVRLAFAVSVGAWGCLLMGFVSYMRGMRARLA
jgi:hypothetical protein